MTTRNCIFGKVGSRRAKASRGQFGARLRLDSGTLTPVLKRLEQAGYVTRRRDAADERRVLVSVTATGRELQDRVSDVPLRLVESLGLDARESRQLRQLLGSLLDRLEAQAGP